RGPRLPLRQRARLLLHGRRDRHLVPRLAHRPAGRDARHRRRRVDGRRADPPAGRHHRRPRIPAVAAMTRVCIAGAGVIGSLFAAHLARVAEVSALVRRKEHAESLREHGLRVSGRSDFTARLGAATSPDGLPEPGLVIVACKGTDLEAVAERLAGHWPAATMMTVQNGIGADEIVGRHGDWPLLTAVTFMSGTRHSDTHVEYVLDTA